MGGGPGREAHHRACLPGAAGSERGSLVRVRVRARVRLRIWARVRVRVRARVRVRVRARVRVRVLLRDGRAVQRDGGLVEEGLRLGADDEGAAHDEDVVGVEREVGAVEDELALDDEG